MRILRIVHRLFPPSVGGIEFHARALSKMQSSMGHEVVVFTTRDPGMPEHEFRDGYEICRFAELGHPFGNPMTLSMMLALMKIDRHGIDIVHAHSHLFFCTNAAALKRKLSSIPLVITNHGFKVKRGPAFNLLQGIYLETLGSLTLRMADRVISLTSDEARRVCSLGVSRGKSVVIPSGVETDLFAPAEQPSDQDTILWAGRFVEEKGVKYLVEAAKLIVREFPSARLLLIGYGPLENHLKMYAEALGISDNVIFMEPVSRETLASFLKRCTVFALPSLSEGFPNVVLEAMACSKPVVATDGIGLNSIVGNAGIFVPPRDPRSLADAILCLLYDQALRRKLGQCARSAIVDVHSWERIADITTELFRQLIDR